MKRRVLAWVGLVVLAPAAGAAAFLLGAEVVATLWGMIGLALAVDTAIAWAFARHTGRRRVAAVQIAAFVATGWAVFFRNPHVSRGDVGGRLVAFERLELPTGSDVGVARLGPRSGAPLVFLHGGPGAPVRKGDVELLRAVAANGVDVAVLEQAGVGESPELDVHAYQLSRSVADLEAVREALGVERISLLGQSFGAVLAYEYLVAHPDRVDRIVLTSPGRLDARFPGVDKTKVDAPLAGTFPAPLVLAKLVHSLNPDALPALLPRGDADGLFLQTLAPSTRASCVKADAPLLEAPPGGADFFQFVALDRQARQRVPAKPSRAPPTLILHGECDFVRPEVAADYRDRLGAVIVQVPGAGHALWPAASAFVRDRIVAFMTDGRRPDRP